MAPGPPQSMTRDQIVSAAVDLVARDGLGSFSMRKLAGVLEVGTMSVYVYFADKDDLLDAMAATVLGEIELSEGPTWRDVLTAWAVETRRVLLGHQNLIPLLVSPDRRDLLDHLGTAVDENLRRIGVTDAGANRQVGVVGRYLAGAVILDTASCTRSSRHRTSIDKTFLVGLEVVLDGLAAGDPDGV